MSRVLPILFNTEMVRAILDGRKTVTRRLVKLPKYVKLQDDGLYTLFAEGTCYENQHMEEIVNYLKPPYQPGDILYVRETFQRFPNYKDGIYPTQKNPNVQPASWDYYYKEDCNNADEKWHPSIHMPKEAARIWLRVMDVRVERLQDMKIEDFFSEGISGAEYDIDTKNRFVKLWDSTIKKSDLDRYGWAANPYVWVIEFEQCEKPESEG